MFENGLCVNTDRFFWGMLMREIEVNLTCGDLDNSIQYLWLVIPNLGDVIDYGTV